MDEGERTLLFCLICDRAGYGDNAASCSNVNLGRTDIGIVQQDGLYLGRDRRIVNGVPN
jgi:hypothetical protein